MIKIEEGKYYRTDAGEKVGPMMPSLKVDWPWIVSLGDGFCWHDDGSPVAYTESPRLIAEWLDGVPLKVEPKLWRDMTPEEKGALMLAHHEGKKIECCAPNFKWFPIEAPAWVSHLRYRVKPEPKREVVEVHGSIDFDSDGLPHFFQFPEQNQTHRIAFDLVDGEPDCDSIRMEKLCQKGES